MSLSKEKKKNLMSRGRLRIKNQPITASYTDEDSTINTIDITNTSLQLIPVENKPQQEPNSETNNINPDEMTGQEETQNSQTANPQNDYHVIMTENLKAWMEESIQMLINSDIKPQKIDEFIQMAKNKPDILTVLARLGPEGVNTIYEIDKDDDFIRTGKIKLLSWINNLSKNPTFRSLVQKLGLAVKALRQLKKMSME
ncbi:MAG: hypothetical protein HQK91_00825 [Nitrospirae bacterium]|nr:hypothetical protein [Nitrospirota bacterium]MBF0539981.1 hypothetical protein [Nitrospirota bacterium]